MFSLNNNTDTKRFGFSGEFCPNAVFSNGTSSNLNQNNLWAFSTHPPACQIPPKIYNTIISNI